MVIRQSKANGSHYSRPSIGLMATVQKAVRLVSSNIRLDRNSETSRQESGAVSKL